MPNGPYGVKSATGETRDTADAYTVTELTRITDPPMTETQVRALITLAGLQPTAIRRPGSQGGRPARTYPLGDFLDAQAVVAPLLLDAHDPS